MAAGRGNILRTHVDETGIHSYDVQLPLRDGSARQVRVSAGRSGHLQPGQRVQLEVNDKNGEVRLNWGAQPAATPAPGGGAEPEPVRMVRSQSRVQVTVEQNGETVTLPPSPELEEAIDAVTHGGLRSRMAGMRKLQQELKHEGELAFEQEKDS